MYFSAWEHPALLHPYIFAPQSPPLAPAGLSPPRGGPECCDGYSYLAAQPWPVPILSSFWPFSNTVFDNLIDTVFLIQCLMLTQGGTLHILNDIKCEDTVGFHQPPQPPRGSSGPPLLTCCPLTAPCDCPVVLAFYLHKNQARLSFLPQDWLPF